MDAGGPRPPFFVALFIKVCHGRILTLFLIKKVSRADPSDDCVELHPTRIGGAVLLASKTDRAA